METAADIQASVLNTLRAERANHDEPLDNLWMLLGGILVFFMHAGFAMLETGTVRFKNAQNILSKNLLVVCIGFLTWFFLGYGFALGENDAGHFFGYGQFAGSTFSVVPTADTTPGNEHRMREWFFQGAFCATSATIVSGSMAERTDIVGFMIYTLILTTFIYPFVVHWGWSGAGFLGYTDENGTATSIVPGSQYHDFAGSGIVHMVGGVGALIGAVIVGPRKNRFAATDDSFAPHNIPLCVLGTLVLWFGWYGFNGASTLSMKTPSDAYGSALVCMNTTLSPAFAGMVVFLLRAKVVAPKAFDVCGICNGILAGLVSITAPCGTVTPGEACIIGILGAFVYQGASMLMQKLKIDDPLDAFAVHGACGFWGVLTVGIFGESAPQGLFYGGDQIGIQFVGAFFISLWVTLWSVPVFLALLKIGILRVAEATEEMGLDEHEHSPRRGYSMEQEKLQQ